MSFNATTSKFSDFVRGLPAATEADLSAGNKMPMTTDEVTKGMSSNLLLSVADANSSAKLLNIHNASANISGFSDTLKKNNLVSWQNRTHNGITSTSLFELLKVNGISSVTGILALGNGIQFDSSKNYTFVAKITEGQYGGVFALYGGGTYLKVNGSNLNISPKNGLFYASFKPDASGSFGVTMFVTKDQEYSFEMLCYVVEGVVNEEDVFAINNAVQEKFVGVEADIERTKNELSAEIEGNRQYIDEMYNNLKDVRLSYDDDVVITIPNTTGEVRHNASVRLNVHKGTAEGASLWDEIFTDVGNFGEVRFFDGETELNHELICNGNWDVVKSNVMYSSQSGVQHLSDNTIILTKSDGIYKTEDNGNTLVRILDSGTCVFIDSLDNLYVYSAYKLYKIAYTNLASRLLIADFSQWQYDIKTSRVAEDSEGTIFVGVYHGNYGSAKVYRMKRDENELSLIFNDEVSQHIHQITINKNVSPNEIFVGVDGVQGSNRPRCYRSIDGGDTFEKLPIPYNNADHGIVYCGNGFYLGCGESNLLGGPTIYRTTDVMDASSYVPVAVNFNGMRKIFSPKPGLIVACCANGAANGVEQFIYSTDEGLSWKPMYINVITLKDTSGDGLRFATDYFIPKGGNEAQVIGDGFSRPYAYRIYFGGERYMASYVVNVGDVPVEGKTISLKKRFMLNTSSRLLTIDKGIHSPVLTAELSEGCGSVVKTNLGDKSIVGNTYEWEDVENVRTGSIYGSVERSKYGLTLNSSYCVIGQLPISDGEFTLGFWVNPVNRTLSEGKRIHLFSTTDNSVRVYISGGNMLFTISGTAVYLNLGYYWEGREYTPYYVTCKPNVDGTFTWKIYVGDGRVIDTKTNNIKLPDLTNKNFVIGKSALSSNELSNILGMSYVRMWDKALNAKEIMDANNCRNYLGN